MVGRGKAKQGRSKKSSSSRSKEEDRISQLPDPLICHILSHLPTKESVSTSVLSTRWKTLWLWVPILELDSRDFHNKFNAFVSFGNRFFHSDRVSCINKLKLYLFDDDEKDDSYITSWIEAALKRQVQHLNVFCPPDRSWYKIPTSLCICETLVSLKLFNVELDGVEFVSLPCLKTMHLKYVYYGKVATFERLISCCPVLEKLKIVGYETQEDDYKCIRVHSLSVKRLNIDLRDGMGDGEKYGVVIDALLLSSLTIDDEQAESYIISNLSANAKLDIHLDFGLHDFDEASVSSRRSSIRDFLLGISKVGEMIVCENTLKIICHYSKLEMSHSKLEPLPQFGYMSHLFAFIYVPDLKWLLTLLGSCPNLKSLVLVWAFYTAQRHSEEMIQISFPFVPECLLSSLMSVEIETSISGYASEMKIVRYFLENSVILKKLTLRLDYRANVNDIFKKLLKIPRRSITCEVVVE
ncbi:PREDICTED: putative FBD-associated F-box protein At5g53635 [Camelina sativa]|uniref:FBD-associated F-box protein At5g53635 n=1 Tax=Camelina sativa TaxID=90675 RepID=A0ABM0UT73_CAMSA|nr:PREDICTED: putative FBD-associated F-box protein At5g53635 [Camelina sativa]